MIYDCIPRNLWQECLFVQISVQAFLLDSNNCTSSKKFFYESVMSRTNPHLGSCVQMPQDGNGLCKFSSALFRSKSESI